MARRSTDGAKPSQYCLGISSPTAPSRRPDDVSRRRAVVRSLSGVGSDAFRPDIEGLRALAVVVVVLFHARVPGFEGGFVGVDVFFVVSGFLITRLLLDRTGPHRHDLAVQLLGPARPSLAPGVGARPGGHGGDLAVDARPAGPTLGGDGCAGVRRVRQQLRVRPSPRGLLRRPARRAAAVAVAALLVVGRRGAVLPRLATDAVRRHPPAAAVPPAAADRHPRRGGRLAAGVDLAHRRAPDVGVLPPAGADGRAAGRRGARCGGPGLPRRRCPTARRARMVRAVRGRRGGPPLRRRRPRSRARRCCCRCSGRCSC